MGGQNSKTDVLKQVLNEVSVNVLNRNSSSATGFIEQKNELLLTGNQGGKIKGFSQANSAQINISAISSSAASGNLQSDLTASLSEAINQEAASIGYTANKTRVRSVVKNVIDSNITVENLQNIQATVSQSNTIKILAESGFDYSDVTQKNEATAILELINTNNAEIIAALQTEGAVTGDLSQTTAPLIGFGAIVFVLLGIAALFLFGKPLLKKMSVGRMVSGGSSNVLFHSVISIVLIIAIIMMYE